MDGTLTKLMVQIIADNNPRKSAASAFQSLPFTHQPINSPYLKYKKPR